MRMSLASAIEVFGEDAVIEVSSVDGEVASAEDVETAFKPRRRVVKMKKLSAEEKRAKKIRVRKTKRKKARLAKRYYLKNKKKLARNAKRRLKLHIKLKKRKEGWSYSYK